MTNRLADEAAYFAAYDWGKESAQEEITDLRQQLAAAQEELAAERERAGRLREEFAELVDSLLADEWTDWNLSDLRQMLTTHVPIQELSKRHRSDVAYRQEALREPQSAGREGV